VWLTLGKQSGPGSDAVTASVNTAPGQTNVAIAECICKYCKARPSILDITFLINGTRYVE
jgi:hypothetical protein